MYFRIDTQGRSHRSGFHWTTFRGTKSRVRGESTVNGRENELQGVAPQSSRHAPSSKGRCVPQTNTVSKVETRAVLCVESVVQYLQERINKIAPGAGRFYLCALALCVRARVANVLGETPLRDRICDMR